MGQTLSKISKLGWPVKSTSAVLTYRIANLFHYSTFSQPHDNLAKPPWNWIWNVYSCPFIPERIHLSPYISIIVQMYMFLIICVQSVIIGRIVAFCQWFLQLLIPGTVCKITMTMPWSLIHRFHLMFGLLTIQCVSTSQATTTQIISSRTPIHRGSSS